jgi:hypothetical protein
VLAEQPAPLQEQPAPQLAAQLPPAVAGAIEPTEGTGAHDARFILDVS